MLIRPPTGLNRRRLLQYGASAGLVAGLAPRAGFAQGAYPSRNYNVVIATGQGGGAETTARAFTNVLRQDLGVDFEYEFHPGAGGQVGYELYAHRRDKDGYNLLYSNMHPEMITYATQDTNYRLPEDITHFAKTNGTPIAVYTGAESQWESLEQVVEEGRRRPITCATSRLPHPGTIGMLALGEATGADFNLIPFGGGNPTSMATITGETDIAVLTSGVAIALGDQVRVLGVFRDHAEMRAKMGNPPLVNDVFGTDIPELELASAWAVHTEVWENMPEFREVFEAAVIDLFGDPRLEAEFQAANYPSEGNEYGGPEECRQILENMIELSQRYADLLQEA
jgi:tripartite-type tricarboxylate transporter receptor subunit TctC